MTRRLTCAFILLALTWSVPALAQQAAVTFTDQAAELLDVPFSRAASDTDALWTEIKEDDPYTVEDIVMTPAKSRGAPGVAIFDYDNDGDLDFYVPNGPRRNAALYQNQLADTGTFGFVDVAVQAGVAAFEQDGSGVCFGDLDNDGDDDLLVLAMHSERILFENRGDGTFADITAASQLAAGARYDSTSCSIGDINGDGLLDIAIVNLFDTTSSLAMFVEPFAANHPNELFLNKGDNVFEDVSESSGFRDLDLTFGAPKRAPTMTWAVALVDVDLDGDLDILQGDDQGIVPEGVVGGIDRGYIQLFENDGTGHFKNSTYETRLNKVSGWMGFAFADFDHNGELDFMATSFGNHARAWARGGPFDTFLEGRDSRWFLRMKDGTYFDPSYPNNLNTPFGWGVVAIDYDNDTDTDLVWQGGMDGGPFVMTTPATVLVNDGTASFTRDAAAFPHNEDYIRRAINGVAAGDLNGDGFMDMVAASGFDTPEPTPLTPNFQLGGPFDQDAYAVATFDLIDPVNTVFTWNGMVFPDGTVSVDMNSGGNGNGWIKVKTLGTVGVTEDARTNRNGIGAVLSVTPEGAATAMKPIVGGSSYASQNELTAHFGMGQADDAVVEVLWPGGVKNRFYGEAGDTVLAVEIPCSFDSTMGRMAYNTCVTGALGDIFAAGLINGSQRGELISEALRAYDEAH